VTDKEFADELHKWWSFDDRQFHTDCWHSLQRWIKNHSQILPKHSREFHLARETVRSDRKGR
jgi:hypothetical protein